tara:strand:+ start:436 stop:930 length:495 start_codon:yes stop_codon:yes gene_type:complete
MKKILYISLITISSSCGFYSFTGASISADVETFSVDYFNNKATTVNASLSSVFTEMLKEHFTSQTSLEQIEDDGDLSFEGEITSYTIKPISIQANETARQNRLTIKVQVKFANKFDEKINFNSTFSRYKDFPADEDLSQVEETYIEEICTELVEDIFNKSVVNW